MIFFIVIALALTGPFLTTGFVAFQCTQVLIYAMAILGLNLLIGINGQFSLGHSAFFALGAYTAAILMEKAGVNYIATLPIAAVLCFIAGFLFGLPALRLEGVYLALATFALAAATPQILKLSPLEHWTGGAQGLLTTKPDAPFDLPLSSDQWLYLMTLCFGLILYGLAKNLVYSRSGRALQAIRDNPIAARSMGVNTALYKASVFGVSAMYTGVAGALDAIVVGFVSPESFTLALSIGLLVGLVIGGVGWLPGAIFGGAFLMFTPNLAEHFHKSLSGAIYGLLLLLVVYILPEGVGGLLRRVAGHRLARVKRP